MSAFSQDALQEYSRTTIAELASGVVEKGQYGEQLRLEIRPLDHEVGGEGTYKEWYKLSAAKDSKMGALIVSLASLKTADGAYFEMETDTGTTDVGAKLVPGSGTNEKGKRWVSPVGAIFRWEQKELTFRGQKSQPFWLPIEVLTPEQAEAEIAAQGGVRKKGDKGNGNGNGSQTTAATATPQVPLDALDDYILDSLGNGLNRVQLARLATQDPELQKPENAAIKKDLISGGWAKRLLASGRLTETGDIYSRTELPEAA